MLARRFESSRNVSASGVLARDDAGSHNTPNGPEKPIKLGSRSQKHDESHDPKLKTCLPRIRSKVGHEHGVDPYSINNDWKNDIDEGNRKNREEGHPLSMAA
ncbi:hypothetical protein N7516_006759 [Penicillium verrucosum]|uniref:uncharacterized protein n=1 Tax=Penicillium verrucosum TaxID=60171 RepID=UPI002545216F|nr:uncharacterized protein N7516_006759 [Penicillium verrucosum]KAJ5932270.1 hypothetical protein N7516_006759 [Penicillium verrucosum]